MRGHPGPPGDSSRRVPCIGGAAGTAPAPNAGAASRLPAAPRILGGVSERDDRHPLDDCPDCGAPMALVLAVLGGPEAHGGGAFRSCAELRGAVRPRRRGPPLAGPPGLPDAGAGDPAPAGAGAAGAAARAVRPPSVAEVEDGDPALPRTIGEAAEREPPAQDCPAGFRPGRRRADGRAGAAPAYLGAARGHRGLGGEERGGPRSPGLGGEEGRERRDGRGPPRGRCGGRGRRPPRRGRAVPRRARARRRRPGAPRPAGAAARAAWASAVSGAGVMGCARPATSRYSVPSGACSSCPCGASAGGACAAPGLAGAPRSSAPAAPAAPAHPARRLCVAAIGRPPGRRPGEGSGPDSAGRGWWSWRGRAVRPPVCGLGRGGRRPPSTGPGPPRPDGEGLLQEPCLPDGRAHFGLNSNANSGSGPGGGWRRSTPWMSWICWANHCVKASSPAPICWKARAESAPSDVAITRSPWGVCCRNMRQCSPKRCAQASYSARRGPVHLRDEVPPLLRLAGQDREHHRL